MINSIEEFNNLDDFGEDIVHFHVFVQNKEGKVAKIPWIISFWNLQKFLMRYDCDAAEYILKVSSSIRSYGSRDSKILQILHSEGFPVHDFVEKYMENFSDEDIQKHIDWSENIALNESFLNKKKELDLLIPDLRSSNSRRNVFAEAIDESLQREIKKFYPEFFDEISAESYSKYDDFLMNSVSDLVAKLNDFFDKESKK